MTPFFPAPVSTACRDIEATMKFMDWFYSDEGADCANLGFVEGEVYDVVNGKKQINDNYEAKNESNVQMKNIYTHDGDFGLVYPNLRYDVADDAAKQAYDLWATGDSTNSAIYTSLPTTVALTADESEAITTHLNDMETYIETTVSTWMCLGAELTDDSWNEFVSTCQTFQLDQILDTYTAASSRRPDSGHLGGSGRDQREIPLQCRSRRGCDSLKGRPCPHPDL